MDVLFRWGHIVFGVAWIGLLYYFNFVQTEYVKEAEDSAKADVMKKLAPRALWWFRWAALFTFLTGLILLWFITNRLNLAITFGAVMGTIMMLNVWGIIWPNQKIVIASTEQVLGGGEAMPEAAGALAKAGLASRTNTLFSLPMLFFMGASAHLTGIGRVPISSDGGTSELAIGLTLLIVAALEFNAIKGKTGPMTSVTGVIHCGIGLMIALLLIIEFL